MDFSDSIVEFCELVSIGAAAVLLLFWITRRIAGTDSDPYFEIVCPRCTKTNVSTVCRICRSNQTSVAYSKEREIIVRCRRCMTRTSFSAQCAYCRADLRSPSSPEGGGSGASLPVAGFKEEVSGGWGVPVRRLEALRKSGGESFRRWPR